MTKPERKNDLLLANGFITQIINPRQLFRGPNSTKCSLSGENKSLAIHNLLLYLTRCSVKHRKEEGGKFHISLIHARGSFIVPNINYQNRHLHAIVKIFPVFRIEILPRASLNQLSRSFPQN